MNWTDDDPGRGSPAGIQGIAALRTARASRIRDAQRAVQTAGSNSGVEWEASSQQSFAAELSRHAADIELVAAGLEKQATALTTYAGQLSHVKDRQVVLATQRANAENDLVTAHSKMPLPDLIPSSTPNFPGSSRQESGPDPDTERRKAAAQGQIDDAQSKIRAVDAAWDTLISDRRRIDATCAAALQSNEVLGSVAAFSASAIAAGSPGALLDRLKNLSEADLAIVLAEHPELADRVNEASPAEVAAWWQSMGAAQQQAFIAGMPSVIGSLNGVSALDRVAANRLNAAKRLQALEKTLAGWKKRAAEPGQSSVRLADIADLEQEIGYLHKAVDEPPTVQLYLYDKDADRIIEMVGTPSSATQKVVTYTPGTLANIEQFYDGDTQQIAQWLQRQDRDGLVAFVYKDGRYPQNPLTEANDEEYGRTTGRQLKEFEDGVFRDPLLAGKQSIGIGHSWGTSNITSAEAEGARWNTVISLSGAGAPVDWKKNPGTSYADFSYNDILQTAQDLRIGDHGAVWGGRNPRDIGFDHGDYYEAPMSWNHFPGSAAVSWILPATAGIDSHNLAASADPHNAKLLDDMREYIYNGSGK